MLQLDTRDIQNAFGRYCRDGRSPVAGVFLKENLPHYRRLIFDLILDTLQKAYPLSHKMLGDEEWEKIARNFFERHPCGSNQLWKLPREFLEYARRDQLDKKQEIPCLLDLLAFEWAEIEVFMMPDQEVAFAPIGDWRKDVLAINPYLIILELNYPVYKNLEEGLLHQEKCPLACYRGWEDFNVYYLKLSDFGRAALQWLTKGYNFSEVLSVLDHRTDGARFEGLEVEAQRFFHLLLDKKIILGKKT